MVDFDLIDRAKRENRVALLRFVREIDNLDVLSLTTFTVLRAKLVGVALSCSSPIGFDRTWLALRVLVLLFRSQACEFLLK